MLGSLITAGSQLIGGLLGKSSADKANATAERQAELNRQMQMDFAQQGIRWKVADAKAAGIHPAFALGASTHSYSPVSIGSTADSSLGNAISSMGQNVGRAVNAVRTGEERAIALKAAALQLEGAGLDNDIKRATLASSVQRMAANANPPMPGGRSFVAPGNMNVSTDPLETPQQKISEEYGDEGLPQLPGQYRFVRDYGAAAVDAVGKRWRREMREDYLPFNLPRWAAEQVARYYGQWKGR